MFQRLITCATGLLAAVLVLATQTASARADGTGALTPRGGELVRPGAGRPPVVGENDQESEESEAGDAAEGDDDEPRYTLKFHGFLRIPMRLGLGEGGKIHSPPHVPDVNYTDWNYTNNMGGPWTELWFEYGDKTVSANIVIAAYDVSEASYRDLQSQLGIAQSFVTLNFPNLFGELGGLSANVGAFVGRYGMAGRYDAGRYDTYLFGATQAAGETLAARFRLTDSLQLDVEHGIGAKLQVAPLVTLEAPYLPYPGDVQQGSTILHHAHTMLTWNGQLTLGLHYMTAFTKDADEAAGEVDGSIATMGAELKLWTSRYGEGYLGFAHLVSKDPLRVAGALQTIHSFEGWNLRDNYFGESATGTGTIDTVLFEYTFSLSTLLWHPQEFYGQSTDLLLSVFGMYNHVASDDPAFTGADSRLKLGGEVAYTPKSWLGVGLRYDLVQPDLKDNTKSFSVITPRVVFSSRFASNEQLILSYSRYLNGEGVVPGYPNMALLPDENVLRVAALMWW